MTTRPFPSNRRNASTGPGRHRLRLAVLGSLVAVPLLNPGAAAAAATGDLDPSWSGDGVQTAADGAGFASTSVLAADGKLVVAGTGRFEDGSSALRGAYVARYTTAGALDTSFGTGGVRKIDITPGAETVRDVTLDGMGRVLVTGYATAPDYPDETDVFVLRLRASGAPDPTFGGDGIITVDRTNHDRGGAITVKGTRILVGASFDSGGNWANQWTVLALTGAGALDKTFNTDGMAEVATTKLGSFDGLRDIAVAADGKIVLGGTHGSEFAAVRMTAAGALDSTWDGDGVVRTIVDGGGAGYKLLVQQDKKVVLAGYSHQGGGRSDNDYAAVRWSAAGKLDASFGGDGRVALDFGAQQNDQAYGAALAADGKIVLAGFSQTASGMDLSAARLNWNGTPDTSFSGDGRVVTSTLATSNEQLESVTVGPADRIVGVGQNLNGWALVGYTGGANTNLTVADASVTEPDTGGATASFVVRLSAASATPVTVRYATVNGTAVAPGDYTARTGTVTFAPGETTKTVAVSVTGDTAAEPTETFTVRLSLPTNAGITDAAATGTIVNDD